MTPTMQKQDKRPFFYGWWIVAELSITETVSYGVLYYAFSVFIQPMEQELGWSRSTITGALSAALLVSGICGVFVGWWLDRHGARLLMTVGGVAATGLMIGWSLVESVIAFYGIWIALGITMAMLFYEPAFTVVANWFTRKRGRALAFVTFIAGFASTIFLPLTNWLYEMQGWRGAVVTLAIILGVTTIPLHGFILRRRPEDLGLLPDGDPKPVRGEKPKAKPFSMELGAAMREKPFWVLTVSFGLATFAASALRVHFFPYLLERGFEPAFGAFVAGLIGAMQVIGRVIFAPLESHLSMRTITAGIFGLAALAFGVLLIAQTQALIILFVVLFGASFGAMTLARPALLGDIYGTTHYGRISSTMVLFITGPVTMAPVIAGALYTAWNGYENIWALLLVLPVLAFGIIWLLPASALQVRSTMPD